MNAYTYIQSPSTLIYTVFGAHNKHSVYKSYFISSETVFIFISLFVCLQQVFFHLLFSFLNFIAITLCFRGIDYVFNCTKVLATEKQRKKDSYFCILQRSFFQHFLFHWRCRQHVEYAWICINRVFFVISQLVVYLQFIYFRCYLSMKISKAIPDCAARRIEQPMTCMHKRTHISNRIDFGAKCTSIAKKSKPFCCLLYCDRIGFFLF